ncbi:hypothetical protein GCM10028805_47550 [Spirosoma harenae]
MTEPEYIAYFENLATRNVDIRHNPENRKAFFVVDDDNRSELENAIRNELDLPALLLDQYYDDQDTEADNNRLKVLGGLSVVCRCDAKDTQSVRAARAEGRRIARSFLNKVRKDCRYGGALYSQQVMISFSAQGEKTPIIGDGSATGWGYGFDLTMPDQVAVNPDDWLD